MAARRRNTRIVGLAVLTLLVILALVYTRPMQAETLFPGLDWDDCERLEFNARAFTSGQSWSYHTELAPGDVDFDVLTELLREQPFRRSLLSLVNPDGAKSHALSDGDFQFDLYAACGNRFVRLGDFYGRLTLSEAYSDRVYRVRTADADTFLETIFTTLSGHPAAEKSRD